MSVRLLTLITSVAQTRVDCDHVVDIPKHLLDEISAAVFRNDIRDAERSYPNLIYALH